jgi:hypothetical protein
VIKKRSVKTGALVDDHRIRISDDSHEASKEVTAPTMFLPSCSSSRGSGTRSVTSKQRNHIVGVDGLNDSNAKSDERMRLSILLDCVPGLTLWYRTISSVRHSSCRFCHQTNGSVDQYANYVVKASVWQSLLWYTISLLLVDLRFAITTEESEVEWNGPTSWLSTSKLR